MKKEFLFEVTEVLRRQVIIEADNEESAKNLIQGLYDNSVIVLDSEDFEYNELQLKESNIDSCDYMNLEVYNEKILDEYLENN